MEHLEAVLEDVVKQACSKLLPGKDFYHQTLLGITVDDTSCFTLLLHGGTIAKSEEVTVSVRKPTSECSELKELVEAMLIEVCWETISNISSVKVEGTMCAFIENTDIILLQIDKTSFSWKPTQIDVEVPVTSTEASVPEDTLSVMASVVQESEVELEPEPEPGPEEPNEDQDQDFHVEYIVEITGGDENQEESMMEVDDTTEVNIPMADEELISTKVEFGDEVVAVEAVEPIEEQDVHTAIIVHNNNTNHNKRAYRKSTPQVCPYCGLDFPSANRLSKHVLADHGTTWSPEGPELVCKFCQKSFANRKNLRRHNCRIKCPHCNLLFIDRIQLNSHILRQHKFPDQNNPNKPTVCPVCHKSFSSWRKLQDHRAIHEIDRLFNITFRKLMEMSGQRNVKGTCSCILCDRTFEFSYHQKRHIINQHKVVGHLDRRNILRQCRVTLTQDRYNKLFIGPVPSLLSLSLSQLTCPCMKSGTEFTCILCKQMRLTHVTVMSHLEKHLMQQKLGRTETTRIDPKTGTEFLLVRRSFPCYICLRKFVSEHTLEVHMMTNHEKGDRSGALLVCNVCKKKYKTPFSLQKHMDKHRFMTSNGERYHSKKPKQCLDCHKCFATDVNLQNHYKKAHGKEFSVTQELTDENTDNTETIENPTVKFEGNAVGVHTRLASVTNEIVSEETVKVKVENNKKRGTKRRRGIYLLSPRKKAEQALCTICGATCCKSSLKTHMARWHGDQKVNHEKRVNPLNSLCPVCGKMMSSNGNLRKHLHTVHADHFKEELE